MPQTRERHTEYMREYRKNKADKAACNSHLLNEASETIKMQSVQIVKAAIREIMSQGHSLTDAEGMYKNYVSANMWQDYLDSKNVKWTGDTQAPRVRKRVDVKEGFKSKAQKEDEKRQSIINILNESNALLESLDRRDFIALCVKTAASKEEEEKRYDALVQELVDRGIPKKQAIENVQWEIKRQQKADALESRKLEHKRALMTDAERTAQKLKILKDNKKLLEKGSSE